MVWVVENLRVVVVIAAVVVVVGTVVAGIVVVGNLVVVATEIEHANTSSPKVLNANKMSPCRIVMGLAWWSTLKVSLLFTTFLTVGEGWADTWHVQFTEEFLVQLTWGFCPRKDQYEQRQTLVLHWNLMQNFLTRIWNMSRWNKMARLGTELRTMNNTKHVQMTNRGNESNVNCLSVVNGI